MSEHTTITIPNHLLAAVNDAYDAIGPALEAVSTSPAPEPIVPKLHELALRHTALADAYRDLATAFALHDGLYHALRTAARHYDSKASDNTDSAHRITALQPEEDA